MCTMNDGQQDDFCEMVELGNLVMVIVTSTASFQHSGQRADTVNSSWCNISNVSRPGLHSFRSKMFSLTKDQIASSQQRL